MGRTKRYDRLEVLDKAMSLFWQKGYLATSMAELTETTGLNTASMYKEFGDKDGFFEAVLRRYRESVMGARFDILTETPDLRGVEAFIEDVSFGASQPAYRGCLMLNHIPQKHAISREAGKLIDDFCASMEAHLETALSNAQRAGSLPETKDPAVLAKYIMCCVHGLVLYGRHGARKSDIPKLYGAILQPVLT